MWPSLSLLSFALLLFCGLQLAFGVENLQEYVNKRKEVVSDEYEYSLAGQVILSPKEIEADSI